MGKQYIIDVADTLAMAFGQRLNLYELQDDPFTGNENRGTGYTIAIPAPEQGEGLGLLGLPIFQRIVLRDAILDEIIDLRDCLVDINLPRQIVKTPRVGADGTVKEFISNGDYEISIKGLFVNQDNSDQIPETDLRAAIKFFRRPRALEIYSGKIFDIFGIHNIVVEYATFPQVPTFLGIRPFELKCVSDTEYIIDLNNNV